MPSMFDIKCAHLDVVRTVCSEVRREVEGQRADVLIADDLEGAAWDDCQR